MRCDPDLILKVAPVLADRAGHPGLFHPDDVRALWKRNQPGDRVVAEMVATLSGWTKSTAA